MTIKSGIDLIRIERIQKAIKKLGQPFLDRIWTPDEQADCLPNQDEWTAASFASLAARFAAKEAVAKALGTGIGPDGIRWTDIEIRRLFSGQPEVELYGAARARYLAMEGCSISVSIAHDEELAIAHCCMLHQKEI